MSGIADASTLVSVDRYRQLTGDTTTISGEVSDALDVALSKVQDYLKRSLVLDEYTELLPITRYKVYPTHTPVVSADDFTVRGNSLFIGYDSWDLFSEGNLAEVTYTGGYDAETVPLTIVDAICKAAYRELQGRQTTTTTVPEGVTSVAVGDVRVTYGSSSSSTSSNDLPPDIAQSIRAYRKQRI
jgi:hypothetical protein